MADKNTKEETKAEKFKRIAESRTEKALNAIALVGGVANTANYEYTEAQVKTIVDALKNEVAKVEKRFANPSVNVERGFSL